MFFLAILLFSYCQMSQHIQKTTANGKEMLSNPKLVLVQGTSNVVMKQNVTLSCLSEPGSPPVRYTLFKHNQQVSALNRSDLTPALFTLTISSASDMGEYKCKAEYNNSSGGKYSNSLKITLIEPISKPVLSSPTSQAKKGQNVTLSCFSENGSLPITYLFFKGTQNISPQKTMRKREAAVIFLFIDSLSDFGTYKCKANNSFPNNTKYSNGFNFTLAEKFKSTRPPIGLTSTVNAEESENEVIYSEIEPVKPEEYINFCVIRREEEKGNLEDPDLTENTCTTKFLQ
ncbi:PREDICTED: allergin-1 isoform X6 [Pseudopodoces humilis]|uniref:allergin-1 isoform X6 n=1 Tax=Pseudopodoces humilis TaxID=181119 RepID=UPI0006B73192|nr:PREDICTED: allergin-1 isoform X6 [Pseudopodoces humilis]